MNFVSVRSRTRRILKAIAFLVLCYFVIAHLLSSITVNENAEQGHIPVYFLTTGVHTDVLVPIKNESYDWSQEILFEHTVGQSKNFNYVAFGWGDKGFYLETPEWADLKASVAFKAASGLSTTAMHTTFYKNPKEGEHCKKTLLTAEQYASLITYIKSSFQYTEDQEPILINTDAVYGRNDAFYEATGSYSLFKTCNSWANGALKAAGQKACLWTPFDFPIFEKYE